MSTTLVKPAEVERKWYLLDASGKSLGHVAAEAAVLLRGKQKVSSQLTFYHEAQERLKALQAIEKDSILIPIHSADE